MTKKQSINYAFKSYVLREHSDLILKQKQCSLHDYYLNRLIDTGEVSPVLENEKYNLSYGQLYYECSKNGLLSVLQECEKINHAQYERIKRLKKRVSDMLLDGQCIFITLTFNDYTLNHTTQNQRRTFISRYLKTFQSQYVANIDFGKTNHREHYHAIIRTNTINLKPWRKYGNINVERIKLNEHNATITRLSKYIAKLTNHAIKETTRRGSLIYSR